MLRYYLVGKSGAHAGQEVPIEQELILGRDSGLSQLVLPGSEKIISGAHCKISVVNGNVQLQDMNSTNGTFLDSGARLTPNFPQTLHNGDCFYLGDRGNLYMVRIFDDTPPPPPPPPPPKKIPGFAIASVAVGVVALVFAVWAALWYFPATRLLMPIRMHFAVPFVLGVVAIVFGALALWKKQAKRMAVGGFVCAVIASAGLGTVMVIQGMGLLEPPTLYAEWRCEEGDLVEDALKSALRKSLPDAGYDGALSRVIVDALGIDAGKLVLTFSEGGALYFGDEESRLAGENIFTWEDLGGGVIRIKADFSKMTNLPDRIPISLSYKCAYALTSNALTMDFFGEEVHFTKFQR